jgi:alkylresorcinol/alkylpyrone synthase
MPSIRSIGTALPEHAFTRQDVEEIGNRWLTGQQEKLDLFQRFLRSSRTEARNFVIPASEMLALNGMKHREELFEHHGPRLGEKALRSALLSADTDTEALTALLFTSCSCPSIPAVDALILERAGLPRTTPRVPIYQHGCAGGVVGIELASDLCMSRGPVALTSVELCSLVFQPGNPTSAQLVGSAIFADGAACAIVGPEDRGLTIVAKQSYLVPNTRHLMGYNVLDDGFHLRLDRELPQALASVAPVLVRDFLKLHNLTTEQIPFWLFHPGGVKILDFLESTFSLRPEQACWSREVLRTVGNISSATVLFVLKAFLDSKVYRHGDKILMLGVGPGLTVELILFEWRDA